MFSPTFAVYNVTSCLDINIIKHRQMVDWKWLERLQEDANGLTEAMDTHCQYYKHNFMTLLYLNIIKDFSLLTVKNILKPL